MKIVDNVLIVIRSAGERTLSACQNLATQTLAEPHRVLTIQEVPFVKAVQKTFEVGIEKQLPWTLSIDADVLIQPQGIRELVDFANTTEGNVFEVQGFVLCKLFGGWRPAGIHLYRTSLLEKGLKCIPKDNVSRPETETFSRMESQGYPYIQTSIRTGLHDYQQYYKDIYRKCFFQSWKHPKEVETLFRPYWTRMSKMDADFRVGLAALEESLIRSGELSIDARLFEDKAVACMEGLGISEKHPYDITVEKLSTTVDNIVRNYRLSPEYQQTYPQRVKLTDLPLWEQWQLRLMKNIAGFKKMILRS